MTNRQRAPEPDVPGPPRTLYSVAVAAAMLGCTASTVTRAIRGGRLAATRDNRSWRITASALAEFQRARGGPPLRLPTSPERARPPGPANADPAPAKPATSPTARQPARVRPRPRPALTSARLPIALTPFFGREAELGVITALLADPGVRLITLVGMGGIGKTRLALEAATIAGGPAPAGGETRVRLVRLDDLARADQLGLAILDALGQRARGATRSLDQVAQIIGDDRWLLVLDTMEHLIDAGPAVIALLAACPALTFLVTSRIVLRVSGERVVPVGPLPVPLPVPPGAIAGGVTPATPDPTAAMLLFQDRLNAVRPGPPPTAAEWATIGEICRRLDGLPLAIELAAARGAALPPADLLPRLEHRLALLADGPQDQPPRLRTMRHAIIGSDALLPAPVRTAFHQLAVFPGGFTLAAAAAMLPPATGAPGGTGELAALPLIETLLRHSLILLAVPAAPPAATPAAGPRYWMLDLLREYGREQLTAAGALAAARDRHAGYYLAAVAAAPNLAAPAWFDWLTEERSNVLAALDWLLDTGQQAAATTLAAGLTMFWHERGHLREGIAWLEAVMARPAPWSIDRLRVAITLAELLSLAGEPGAALTHANPAVTAATMLDQPALAARARLARGTGYEHLGDFAAANNDFTAAHALALTSDAPLLVARALDFQAAIAWATGDHAAYIQLAEAALATWRPLGDLRGLIGALDQRSLAARVAGDLRQQALLAAEIVMLTRPSTDPYQIASALWTVAAISAERGQAAFAARMFGTELAVRQASGFVLNPSFKAEYIAQVTALQERLGHRQFAALSEAGAALPAEDALTESLAAMQLLATASGEPGGDLAAQVARNLTPRELEVLRLLVSGLSDKEIAAALFVARSTASKHVSSILEKLGVSSRTAAVAIASREGLVTNNAKR